ncbi:MAG: enolase C-terminal domain-like protein [Candidatus Nanoarchaeia archaeon]|nr:enolase C-terminal domain-like protein [Candidatus Nanoarchaeia archaeon]
MIIKKVIAKAIRDSRGEKTIKVTVKTSRKFKTSSPFGKSTGKYEAKPYSKNLTSDISYINKLDVDNLNKLFQKNDGKTIAQAFLILQDTEKLVKNKIGANSLFALEAGLLKALAYENKKELWEFLTSKNKPAFPRPVGNAIGGGLHGEGIQKKEPDFQEFLFISNGRTFSECVEINELAYNLTGKLLGAWTKNDEGAWLTGKTNEEVLMILDNVRQIIKNEYKKEVDIGVDIASSSFYKDNKYNYKNPAVDLNKKHQILYINELIRRYKLFYVEDPLDENDFTGFKELSKEIKKTGNKCHVVGDDLTTTNPERLKKAIKNKSIDAIIVKPNQIGSLLKVKEVIEIARKNRIKTIISHRSGETKDSTIADLAIGFRCDFIKTGIHGKVRTRKLRRLIEIEKKLR